MIMPNIKNTLVDPGSKITYEIVAYRQLTKEEMILSVRNFMSQKKKPKLKPGQTIQIVTIIGHNE